MIYLDLSPYTLSALRFKGEIGCSTEWMEPHYALSRILRTLGAGYLPLVGLPMAVFADMARVLKYIGKSRRSEHSHLESGGPLAAGKP